jgi:hypothetical protein
VPGREATFHVILRGTALPTPGCAVSCARAQGPVRAASACTGACRTPLAGWVSLRDTGTRRGVQGERPVFLRRMSALRVSRGQARPAPGRWWPWQRRLRAGRAPVQVVNLPPRRRGARHQNSDGPVLRGDAPSTSCSTARRPPGCGCRATRAAPAGTSPTRTRTRTPPNGAFGPRGGLCTVSPGFDVTPSVAVPRPLSPTGADASGRSVKRMTRCGGRRQRCEFVDTSSKLD